MNKVVNGQDLLQSSRRTIASGITMAVFFKFYVFYILALHLFFSITVCVRILGANRRE